MNLPDNAYFPKRAVADISKDNKRVTRAGLGGLVQVSLIDNFAGRSGLEWL
jgi:hypothetical protein